MKNKVRTTKNANWGHLIIYLLCLVKLVYDIQIFKVNAKKNDKNKIIALYLTFLLPLNIT